MPARLLGGVGIQALYTNVFSVGDGKRGYERRKKKKTTIIFFAKKMCMKKGRNSNDNIGSCIKIVTKTLTLLS